MPGRLIILVFLHLAVASAGQGVFQRRFESKNAFLFDVGVKRQWPGGDLADRFGKNASLGLDFSYKTKSNWMFTVGGHFIFGKEVYESGILDSLKGPGTGEIIDQNGQFSVIGLDQRGMFWNAMVTKIVPVVKSNRNSGIFISAGGGYLQHRIRIYATQSVPQLTDEYKKGYDRLTFGPALCQHIGYRFLDPKKQLNFTVGFEMIEGFTQNRRSYNFDTRMADTRQRLDLLYGIKISLSVPLYPKKADEEEFFE